MLDDGWGSDGWSLEVPEEDRAQFPALHKACFQGNADEVRRLLAMGADPNGLDEDRAPPLFDACGLMGWDTGVENYVGVVEALLEEGAQRGCVQRIREHAAALCRHSPLCIR
jgi:hypothetical protein